MTPRLLKLIDELISSAAYAGQMSNRFENEIHTNFFIKDKERLIKEIEKKLKNHNLKITNS